MTTDPHPHRSDGELNIIRIPADEEKPLTFATIRQSLEGLQKEVGGYIEMVRQLGFELGCRCPLLMVANEEGLLLHLEPNLRATRVVMASGNHLRGTIIVGDVFLLAEGPCYGADGVEPDFVSLPLNDDLLKTVRTLTDA
jgi:Domain of unknown function (DUF3846)